MAAKNIARLVSVVVVIVILALLTAYGFEPLNIPGIDGIRKGIDIKGGVYTTLYADLPEGQVPTKNELDAAVTIIEKRLDSKGIFDRNIAPEVDKGRIVVEIPYKQGETDLNPQKAIDEIGKTALLTFQEVDENLKDENGLYKPTGKIILQGTQILDATPEIYSQSGEIVVALSLNDEGAKSFEEATGRLVGKPIAIFMDDQIISWPRVEQQISGGNAVITGQRDAKEAGELASTIRAGSLPFRLVAKEINSITPLLGEGALRVAIIAGIVAFILVALFMLFFYRLPGLLSIIALTGLVTIELAFILWLKVSVTLPGIAGIILSIGMGVDANVIIFERIKEELKTGKTIRASIDTGFKRAFSAILDSNVTTLITSIILFWLGTGPIKGFAVTLTLGVALSFLTAVTVSRILLKSVSEFSFSKNRWLYGLKKEVAK